MTAVLPVIANSPGFGSPNDTSIKDGINTPAALVDTYLKMVSMYTNMDLETLSSQRCMALARHLGTPELFSYFKAALQAAMEKTEAVARQSSAPLDSSEVISILVNCLVHEFNKAKLVPQLMEAVETVWSDEGSPSSLCGRAQDVMGRAVSFVKSKLAKGVKTVVPAVLLSEVLGLLPLASGAPTERGDEVTEAELRETSTLAEESLGNSGESIQHPLVLAGVLVFNAGAICAFGRYLRRNHCCTESTAQDEERPEEEWIPLTHWRHGEEEAGSPHGSNTNGPDQFIFMDVVLMARWGTRWYPLPDDFEWDMTDKVIKSKPLILKDGKPVVSDGEVIEVPYTFYEDTTMNFNGTCPLWTKLPEGYHKAEQLRVTAHGQTFFKFEDAWYKVHQPILHDGKRWLEGPCLYKDEQGRVEVAGTAKYEVPLEPETEAFLKEAYGSVWRDAAGNQEPGETQVGRLLLYESTESIQELMSAFEPGPTQNRSTQTVPDNIRGDPRLSEIILTALNLTRADLIIEVPKSRWRISKKLALHKLQEVDEIIEAVTSTQRPSIGPRRWSLEDIMKDREMSKVIMKSFQDWDARLARAEAKKRKA